jgi:leader peptidase (prepilin peptidase)/N-methyltransferase
MAAGVTPAVLLAVVAGVLMGALADRIAARWPAQAGVPRRPVGGRTLLLALIGALALGALAWRWPAPQDQLVLGAWSAALLVLLATDLEQKLLPDAITLPLIPLALVAVLAGVDPLLAGKGQGLASAILAAIGAPALLLVTDRLLRGALGFGDVKLAVSLGLMLGVSRLLAGFLLASIASAVILLALIAARRLTLRSAIPFGPILIGGAWIGALLA